MKRLIILAGELLISHVAKKAPDVYIGGKENPYLLRWWLTRYSGLYRDKKWEELTIWQKFVRSLPNVYLHNAWRSDEDRALHDHPWVNASIILKGGYTEIMPVDEADPFGPLKEVRRQPGDIVIRKATAAHRLVLDSHYETGRAVESWSLFITGPKVREWGFYCPQGWRHWTKFVDPMSNNIAGPGCD